MIELKQPNTGTWVVMPETDTTALNIIKDEKSEMFLEGSISFLGNDFDYLMSLKDDFQNVEIRKGQFFGLVSLQGKWNYSTRKCTLKSEYYGQYKDFERIIDKDSKPSLRTLQFDFDSWLISKMGSAGLSAPGEYLEDYTDHGSKDADTYDSNKVYSAANILAGGKYAGDPDNFVWLSGKNYASLQDNNSHNNPADPGSLYWAEVTDLHRYDQERSEYEFNGSKYSDLYNYWWKPSSFTDTYTTTVIAYNLRDQLANLLSENGFLIHPNYLNHAKIVNNLYDADVYIVNDKVPDVINLTTIIGIYKQLFNVDYRLQDGKMYFVHVSEIAKPYDGTNNFSGYSLPEYDSITNNVNQHILEFTKSNFSTHENSIIYYDNDFTEKKRVKGNFDVDFRFAQNKGGINIPVTLLSDSKIDTSNPYFVPKLLHENFYFDWREYKQGKFFGITVNLNQAYTEKADLELPPSFSLDGFDMDKEAMTEFGVGRITGVTFYTNKNKYKLSIEKKV